MPEPEKTEKKQEKARLPQHFKPGQSGNPKGRPRGARGLSTILKQALKGLAKNKNGAIIIDQETNEPMTWEQALVKRVIDKAIIKGNDKTIELIWDRLEGKPKQMIKVDDDGRDERFTEIRKIVSILTHGNDATETEDSSEEAR